MSVDTRRAGAFGDGAEVYVRGRPGYPEAALRACLPAAPRRALDLAAGTGKLTAGLLALGLDVVAVEPLAQMRARIDPRAEIPDGRAEAIPLPAASVDAVLVGQAFHWFERDCALAQIVRPPSSDVPGLDDPVAVVVAHEQPADAGVSSPTSRRAAR